MMDENSWHRTYETRMVRTLSEMPTECQALYHMILLTIFEDGGPVHDFEDFTLPGLGGLARLAPPKAEAALSWLIKEDYVQRKPGFLDIAATHEELSRRRLWPQLRLVKK